MYVKIPDLRAALLHELEEDPEDTFDCFLLDLLKDPKYKSRISLSGAPLTYVKTQGMRPFVFKGRNYYYLSILHLRT